MLRNAFPLIILTITVFMFSCEDKYSDEPSSDGPIRISLKTFHSWKLASTPLKFPEASLNNSLQYNYNRAKLAWYVIDPIFLRNTSSTPDHLTDDDKSSHDVREVYDFEIYHDKETYQNIPSLIPVLNIAFFPNERGPYNYDTYENEYSSGINTDGFLRNPHERWGGIGRNIPSQLLEDNKSLYLEFWLMDPFHTDEGNSGDLYFNIGVISEDVLKDNYFSCESNLPYGGTDELPCDTTVWGIIGNQQNLSFNFYDNILQDIGLDGLSNTDEAKFFSNYLEEISEISLPLYNETIIDPSNDDFHYYRGSDYDEMRLSILDRYKKYNNMEGNSPLASSSPEPYITSGSTLPDMEDFDDDFQMNTENRYREYHIPLSKHTMYSDTTRLVESHTCPVEFQNGVQDEITWYHYKINLDNFDNEIGNPIPADDYKYIRIYLTNFSRDIVLRFAELTLTLE